VAVTAGIRAAITTIDEQAWTDIAYRHAICDEQEQRWISDAQIAKTAFAGTKHTKTTGRRRVKRPNTKAAQGARRAVHALAPPRRVHRLPPPAGPGRATTPLMPSRNSAWPS